MKKLRINENSLIEEREAENIVGPMFKY